MDDNLPTNLSFPRLLYHGPGRIHTGEPVTHQVLVAPEVYARLVAPSTTAFATTRGYAEARDIRRGDVLWLLEWEPVPGRYTGGECTVAVKRVTAAGTVVEITVGARHRVKYLDRISADWCPALMPWLARPR